MATTIQSPSADRQASSPWRSPASTAPVRLPEVEPDLFAGLSPAELKLAHHRVLVATARIPPGVWQPSTALQPRHGHAGYLILSGLVCRDVSLANHGAPELLGPGDVVRPWADDGALASVPARCHWRVLEALHVAVLDGHFARSVGPWPSVLVALSDRTFQRSRGLMFRLALTRVPRVETRLLMMLWHLAERWGRVSPEGVALPLRLTHEQLGELVGAHRPTITVAVRRLTAEGRISRLPRKGWLLLGSPPDVPASAATTPAGAPPAA